VESQLKGTTTSATVELAIMVVTFRISDPAPLAVKRQWLAAPMLGLADHRAMLLDPVVILRTRLLLSKANQTHMLSRYHKPCSESKSAIETTIPGGYVADAN